MITALIILAGFVSAGITIGLIVTSHAPVGYQDETGFHYGRPDGVEHNDEVRPVALPRPKLA